jgi:rRNA maturation RNase YbeY
VSVIVSVLSETKSFTGHRLWRVLAVRSVRKVLKGELPAGRRDRVVVSVIFIGDRTMARLNRLWKKRTGPTDVLSFNFNESRPEGFFLGEIYISIDTLIRQARKAGHSVADELSILLIHGSLHLLGHEHNEGERKKNVMVRKESFYRSRLMIGPKI